MFILEKAWRESLDPVESVLSLGLLEGVSRWLRGAQIRPAFLCGELLPIFLASLPPRMKGRSEDLGEKLEAIHPVWKTSRNVF